ncbi:MAG: hypothetical protein NC094_05595 [Bacteroidales bacterium]|nr:hypothetical protein [Lachnoclostridium sp.]MCM1464876.1 hypothetical protein [Bacteroidales bacterium]
MKDVFKVEKTRYINKTFRIEENLLKRLEQVSTEENISINSLVVQCCKFALDRRTPKENSDKKQTDKQE